MMAKKGVFGSEFGPDDSRRYGCEREEKREPTKPRVGGA